MPLSCSVSLRDVIEEVFGSEKIVKLGTDECNGTCRGRTGGCRAMLPAPSREVRNDSVEGLGSSSGSGSGSGGEECRMKEMRGSREAADAIFLGKYVTGKGNVEFEGDALMTVVRISSSSTDVR